MADPAVLGNLEDVSGCFADFRAESPSRPPEPEKRLLGEVFGKSLTEAELVEEVEHPVLVLPEELFKRC
jgi:hypothetical protein